LLLLSNNKYKLLAFLAQLFVKNKKNHIFCPVYFFSGIDYALN